VVSPHCQYRGDCLDHQQHLQEGIAHDCPVTMTCQSFPRKCKQQPQCLTRTDSPTLVYHSMLKSLYCPLRTKYLNTVK
jgi:hypothetical protein